MRIVRWYCDGSDYVSVEPENGDRIELQGVNEQGTELVAFENGQVYSKTDKINYPSLGGVAFIGGNCDGLACFIEDPCWAAAISKTCEDLWNGAVRHPSDTIVIESMPYDEAVQWLRRYLGEYPVAGYEYGPDKWTPAEETQIDRLNLPGASKKTIRQLTEAVGRLGDSSYIGGLLPSLSDYALSIDGYGIGERVGVLVGTSLRDDLDKALKCFEFPDAVLTARVVCFILQRGCHLGPSPADELRLTYSFLDTYHRPLSLVYMGLGHSQVFDLQTSVLAALTRRTLLQTQQAPTATDVDVRAWMFVALHGYGYKASPKTENGKFPEVTLAYLADIDCLRANRCGQFEFKDSYAVTVFVHYLELYNRYLFLPDDPMTVLLIMRVYQAWLEKHPEAFERKNRNRFAYYLLYLHLYRLRFPEELLNDSILKQWRTIPSAVKEHRAATFRRRIAEAFYPHGV